MICLPADEEAKKSEERLELLCRHSANKKIQGNKTGGGERA